MQQPKTGMTVDEFLLWAEDCPGRYELLDGIVYGMSPERAGHARAKSRVHRAMVYCGERLPDHAIEVPAPVVVVEVLSPGTRMRAPNWPAISPARASGTIR